MTKHSEGGPNKVSETPASGPTSQPFKKRNSRKGGEKKKTGKDREKK